MTLYSKHKSTNLSLTELIDVNETDKLLHSSIPSIGIHLPFHFIKKLDFTRVFSLMNISNNPTMIFRRLD